jgi:hypothetical protein
VNAAVAAPVPPHAGLGPGRILDRACNVRMTSSVPRCFRFPGFLAAAFLVLLAVPGARAQLTVTMQPSKKLYVAHEPIAVDVAITNRAGRDIVLAGRGTPWLSFSVTDSNGNLVSPSGPNQFEPVMVPAGQMLSRRIAVNGIYPMGQKGLYRVSASVYFPQLDRYFQSQPVTIQVSDGRELWRQVVGVPAGREGEGTYRRYSLLSFNTGSERHLYVRVQNDRSGAVLATFSLGQFIAIRDPEWTIDRENRLHVLHLGAPRTYAHTVVDVDGEIVSRTVYREEAAGRPQLAPSGDGDVVVVGGISEEEAARNPLGPAIRMISERPDGLPRT